MERRRLAGIGFAVRFHHNKQETQKNWSRPKVGTQGKELDLLLVFDTDLKIFCG
jgi:hypothetical protein